MSNARYLNITIHDNDFGIELEFVAELLKSLIDFFSCYESYDIEDKDLPYLKSGINYLLYGVYKIYDYFRAHNNQENTTNVSFDYFEPDLKIVDYLDIPEWDNGKSVFIPLFKGDIIVR